MHNRIPVALLGASLLLGCGEEAPRDPALDEPAVDPAEDTTSAGVFVRKPPSGAQLVFVGAHPSILPSDRSDAVFVPLSTFAVERDGIPNMLPSADSIVAGLQEAGVHGGHVVIVGDPIPAGRAFAAFDYLGLGDRATVLDGGPAALPTSSSTEGAPEPVAGGADTTDDAELEVDPRVDVVVGADWVHDMLETPTVALLDARPPAEFSGETPGAGIERPGHIPGARNVFWETLIESAENPRLKNEAELRRIFEEAGVGPDDTVVAYCRTGMQSGFLYAVARHLGYSVRLYDGSFFEWSRTDYPVER